MSSTSTNTRYGIVGVGLMGMEHIHNILHLPGTTISCIADDYPESIHNCMSFLNREHPGQVENLQVFANFEDMFRQHLCDIAIIATPNHTHHDVVMSAFTIAHTNMHILIEKPMCTTISDCRAVITAASRRKGLTYVGLEYRYMPPITRVIRDARAGVIGHVHMVAIREHRFPFLDKIRNWNRFSCNSGGTFVEKCCHFFDLFNKILYPNIPKSVFASGAQDVNHLDEEYGGKKCDIFDNGYVIVNFSNGRRACLDLCMFAEASHSQEEVCIVGSKGKVEAFLPQQEVRTGLRGEHKCGQVTHEIVDDNRIKYRGHHYGSSYLEHLDILKQICGLRDGGGDTEKVSTAGLYHGLLSVAVGVAAHLSIEEERVVKMAELLSDEELELCSSGL